MIVIQRHKKHREDLKWHENTTTLRWRANKNKQNKQSGVDEEVETQGQDEGVEQVRADWVNYGTEENTEIKTQQKLK